MVLNSGEGHSVLWPAPFIILCISHRSLQPIHIRCGVYDDHGATTAYKSFPPIVFSHKTTQYITKYIVYTWGRYHPLQLILDLQYTRLLVSRGHGGAFTSH